MLDTKVFKMPFGPTNSIICPVSRYRDFVHSAIVAETGFMVYCFRRISKVCCFSSNFLSSSTYCIRNWCSSSQSCSSFSFGTKTAKRSSIRVSVSSMLRPRTRTSPANSASPLTFNLLWISVYAVLLDQLLAIAYPVPALPGPVL